MTTRTFTHLLDTTASTKRTPAKASGKIGVPATNLSSVSIVAPQPVDPELKELYKIDAVRRAWLSFAASSADILAGDLITVSGTFTDAKVVAVGAWDCDDNFLELIISE